MAVLCSGMAVMAATTVEATSGDDAVRGSLGMIEDVVAAWV